MSMLIFMTGILVGLVLSGQQTTQQPIERTIFNGDHLPIQTSKVGVWRQSYVIAAQLHHPGPDSPLNHLRMELAGKKESRPELLSTLQSLNLIFPTRTPTRRPRSLSTAIGSLLGTPVTNIPDSHARALAHLASQDIHFQEDQLSFLDRFSHNLSLSLDLERSLLLQAVQHARSLHSNDTQTSTLISLLHSLALYELRTARQYYSTVETALTGHFPLRFFAELGLPTFLADLAQKVAPLLTPTITQITALSTCTATNHSEAWLISCTIPLLEPNYTLITVHPFPFTFQGKPVIHHLSQTRYVLQHLSNLKFEVTSCKVGICSVHPGGERLRGCLSSLMRGESAGGTSCEYRPFKGGAAVLSWGSSLYLYSSKPLAVRLDCPNSIRTLSITASWIFSSHSNATCTVQAFNTSYTLLPPNSQSNHLLLESHLPIANLTPLFNTILSTPHNSTHWIVHLPTLTTNLSQLEHELTEVVHTRDSTYEDWHQITNPYNYIPPALVALVFIIGLGIWWRYCHCRCPARRRHSNRRPRTPPQAEAFEMQPIERQDSQSHSEFGFH